MVKTGYSELSKSLKTFFFGSLLMHLGIIVTSTLVTIFSYSSDCSGSIRMWLVVSSSVSGGVLVIYILKPFIGTCIWLLWNLVWSLIGVFWLSKGDCMSDFSAGYTVTLSIIIINFGVVSCLIAAGCLFSIALCIGYGLSSRYHEMNE